MASCAASDWLGTIVLNSDIIDWLQDAHNSY